MAGGVAFLEALRQAGVRRLVFSSTAAVYGTPASVPIREDAVLAPINPYGETKRTFEGALRWYAAAYGLRSVSLRYFNVAGASARNGEVHDPETHLIPNVLAAAEGRAALTVFGTDYPTPDGTCVRDYLHVEDLARAHVLALEATSPDDPRTTVSDGPAGESRRRRDRHQPRERGRLQRARSPAGGRARGRPCRSRTRSASDAPAIPRSWSRMRAAPTRSCGWRAAHRDIVEIVASAWAWRQAHPDGYRA